MSFHFSKQQPPDLLLNNIKSFDKFNDDQFKELFEMGLEAILQPENLVVVQNKLSDFSSDNGVNIAALRNIFKSLMTVLSGASRNNTTSSEINEDFIKLGLSSDKAEYASNKWEENNKELARTALSHTLMVNQLVDLEWKFGVTASSSDLNKVGNTFLQLKLVINNGNKLENVFMELTLPQFYQFLHEMEKAKASLEYFS